MQTLPQSLAQSIFRSAVHRPVSMLRTQCDAAQKRIDVDLIGHLHEWRLYSHELNGAIRAFRNEFMAFEKIQDDLSPEKQLDIMLDQAFRLETMAYRHFPPVHKLDDFDGLIEEFEQAFSSMISHVGGDVLAEELNELSISRKQFSETVMGLYVGLETLQGACLDLIELYNNGKMTSNALAVTDSEAAKTLEQCNQAFVDTHTHCRSTFHLLRFMRAQAANVREELLGFSLREELLQRSSVFGAASPVGLNYHSALAKASNQNSCG